MTARSAPAVVALAVLLAAVLGTSGGDGLEPSRSAPSPHPLRVTSGNEVATGFAAGGNRVVTVAHVLDRSLAVNGRRARVLRVDRRSDLALVAVPGLVSHEPALASANAGAGVRVLRLRSGRTSSLPVRVRRAIVARVRTPAAANALSRPALELAGKVAAGDSGAPVVSSSSALVGVIFATSRRREDTAYAVDASAVRRLLASG